MVSVSGRDLMGQLEDHDAISFDDKPIRANNYSASQVIQMLTRNTRISKFQLQKANSVPGLFSTEPGESKLAALQRYMEPMNCISWMSPKGALIYGKPNMAQGKKGTLTLSKSRRESNVLSMKVTRASSTIPNLIVACWSGQEEVQDRVEPRQRLYNRAQRPALLRGYGHIVSKSIVTSNPDATTAQGQSGINALTAGSSDFLQSYVKREFARRNMEELKVQAVVPGHFNDAGEPFVTDTVYEIQFDRGSVSELMYLYSVEYELTLERGQITKLGFCRFGTIVGDNAGA
jgi:prophage tail gpP-like protein